MPLPVSVTIRRAVLSAGLLILVPAAAVPFLASPAAAGAVARDPGTRCIDPLRSEVSCYTPLIGSVSPSSGPVSGGTSVTIRGGTLSYVNEVMFGSVSASSFTVVSASEIIAVAPAQSAGTVDVTATAPGGTSPIVAGDEYTYTSG
jgi:hypothetical protein